MVFGGYHSNGRPEWMDFLRVLLGAGYKDTGKLFTDKGSLIAYYFHGRDLKQRLLHNFGKASKTYDILGQIVAGYFSINPSSESDEIIRDIALTFQVVESRDLTRNFVLNLNVIGRLPDEYILDYLADGRYERLYRIFVDVQKKFKSMESEINTTPTEFKSNKKNELLRHIPAIMIDVVKTLEHHNRQKNRRTRHALERISQNRPIPAAALDVKKALREAFYMDERKDTIIVLGPKQRIHVFSSNARHVTSLKLSPEQIHGRVVKKRWRLMNDDEYEGFLDKFNRLYPNKIDTVSHS
jgi:hypothetical protein